MPRVTLNQTNFTAGEISPKCYGRVDVSRYQNGAKSLRNCIVNIHGGAQRRPGSLFIAATKDHAKRSRLIPFVFSRTQAYMLEFGDQYMRAYVASAGQVLNGAVPFEIATPYTEAMLAEMDYVQGADTMFIFHQDVLVNTLRRLSPSNWVLGFAPFTTLPFDEIGHRINAQLTLSASTVGAGRALTAAAGVFQPADVGRRITYESGVATIMTYVGPAQVTADITAAFGVAVLPANDWVLEDSPQSDLKPQAKSPVGALIDLTFVGSSTPVFGPTKNPIGVSYNPSGSLVTMICPGHGFANNDHVQVSGFDPIGYNGLFQVLVPDVDTFTYTLTADPGAANSMGSARSANAAGTVLNGWRPEDAGKFVRINGGLVRITTYLSANLVKGELIEELTSDVAAPANSWVLMGAEWNAYDGYPRTGAFYEQRVVAAGTRTSPQKVWGSRSGEYFNFIQGTADDDGFAFSLPSTGQINPITRIMSARALLPLTYGGEYTMSGGVEKPLTPTNVQIKDQSVYGCNNVKPVRVGSEVLFVQRAGKKLRALSYKFDTDSYTAPDLTVLAEHITKSGVTDMCYQQEPRSLLWCVRADGKLAILTLDREEGVIAWTPQDTDGAVESIASIPNATGDEVWVIVRRTIGGQTRRYVERFEEGLYTDCGIIGASVPGASVWAGLGHLEGKEVAVRADGVDKGLHTVQGGQITIDRDAFAVEIGLPFTNQVTLLRPEVQAGDATAQGNAQRVHEVSLLFMETIGAKINGEEISFRQFGSDLLDQAPAEFSGIKGAGLTDWTRGDQEITIAQDGPNPFHLLSVIRKFTVNS